MIYRADLNKKTTEVKPKQKRKLSLAHLFKKKAKQTTTADIVPTVPPTLPINTAPAIIETVSPEVVADVAPQKVIKTAKPKKKFNFKLVIGLLILFFLVLGGLFAYDRISSYSSSVQSYNEDGTSNNVCDNILNPACWTAAFRPQLKQTDGYTSVLIIGTDTRTGTTGLMNTDSIIILTFNQATQEYMLTSIPRDFWSFAYSAKINAVYAYTYKGAKADYNDEFYYLKKEIKNVLGKEINYTVKVRFDGLTKLVDSLGGVQVCPATAFTAKYPNDTAKKGEAQWLSYSFTAGCQTLDGEKALVYSRFRYLYNGPAVLASDFSRAARQQEVFASIKDELLNQNMTIAERAEKYWSLFQTLSGSIDSDFTFEDLLAGLSYVDTFDSKPLNVVLDPNFGGLNNIIYTDSNATQGYTIKSKVKDYSNIQSELAKIWKYSAFYKEKPILVVRNQTGSTLASNSAAVTLKSTSYYESYKLINDPESTQLTGVHIFDFTGGKDSRSLAYLKSYFGVTTVETLPEEYGIERSKANEDFLIVIGPDTLPSTATPTPTN